MGRRLWRCSTKPDLLQPGPQQALQHPRHPHLLLPHAEDPGPDRKSVHPLLSRVHQQHQVWSRPQVRLTQIFLRKIFMKTQVTRDQCRDSIVKYFNVSRYADNNLRSECSLRPVVNWLRAGKIQCVSYCCDTLYLYLILFCQDFSWYRAPVFDIVNSVCWLSLWEWKLL